MADDGPSGPGYDDEMGDAGYAEAPVDDGVGPSDDEFEDEEHPDDVVRGFGNHPMMENIQKALFSQLEREHERVLLEKREAEAELKVG